MTNKNPNNNCITKNKLIHSHTTAHTLKDESTIAKQKLPETFCVLPLLFYFALSILQLVTSDALKKSEVLYHLIINFFMGLICLLVAYYCYSGNEINYIFITLLASLLVVFTLLFRFLNKY